MARSTARRRSSCIATSWSRLTRPAAGCWHSPTGSANLTRLSDVTGFREVAGRVWVARQEWFDLNVCLVGGADGLLVVDTQASARAARAIVDDVRALGAGPVTAVFNTHEHFDHTFGNGAFRDAFGSVPIHAHDEAAARTLEAGERVKQRYVEDLDDPHRDELLETAMVPADQTLSSVRVLDLGDS